MKPALFDYHDPAAVDGVLDLLAEHGDDAKVLAGGQSLVPMLNFRLAHPDHLVDLRRIAALAYVRRGDGVLRIGTMTRQATLESSPLVAEHWPLLTDALRFVAHAQIRNRGTVGGSVAHADPAAELPVAFTALDAVIHVRSLRGARKLDCGDFFVTHLTTALEPDELLVEIEVPPVPAGTGWAFTEYSRRHGDFRARWSGGARDNRERGMREGTARIAGRGRHALASGSRRAHAPGECCRRGDGVRCRRAGLGCAASRALASATQALGIERGPRRRNGGSVQRGPDHRRSAHVTAQALPKSCAQRRLEMTANPIKRRQDMKLVDLTHKFSIHTPGWVGYPSPKLSYFQRHATNGIVSQWLELPLHSGTHFDGQMHIVSGGSDIASVPIERLCREGVIVDISDAMDDWAVIKPHHITERAEVRAGDILIYHTGYHRYFNGCAEEDEERYFLRHPGGDREFAEWLVEMNFAWTGFDCGSADHPMNTTIRYKRPDAAARYEHETGIRLEERFPANDIFVMHKVPFPKGVLHVENMGGDIEQALGRRCLIGAFPIPIEGGEASPCRVVAFIDE